MSWCVGNKRIVVEGTDGERVFPHVEGLYTSPATTSRGDSLHSEWAACGTECEEEKELLKTFISAKHSDAMTRRGRNHRHNGLQREGSPHKSAFIMSGNVYSAEVCSR